MFVPFHSIVTLHYPEKILNCTFGSCLSDLAMNFSYLLIYKSYHNSYSPGDVLMIQPSNLSDVADEFINYLALNPNQIITLSRNFPGTVYILP